jgi:hypothetical protein
LDTSAVPVVGVHVPVDVEHAQQVGGSVGVAAGQPAQQLITTVLGGQLAHPPPHGLDLQGTVQADQPAQVGRVDPAQPLDARLADQRRERQRQQQRP